MRITAPSSSRRRAALAGTAAAVVLGATGVGFGVGRSTAPEGPDASASPAPVESRSLVATEARGSAQIAAAVVPGVVSITSSTTGGFDAVAGGTGFVLDRTGRIVTNQHVVAGASSVHVSFADGTKAKANVLAEDKLLDLTRRPLLAPRA